MPEPVSEAMEFGARYLSYFRSVAQLWNTTRGDLSQIEHWDDFSAAAVAGDVERLANLANAADELRTTTAGDDALTLAIIAAHARAEATIMPWARDRNLVSAPVGLMALLHFVPRYVLVSAEHGTGYVTKLENFGSFVDNLIDGLRSSMARGIVATARGVTGQVDGFDRLLALDDHAHPFAAQGPPSDAAQSEQEAWRGDVLRAIREVVRPAFVRLRTVLHDELLPLGSPDNAPGLCYLPDGRAEYERLVAAETSTNISPEEVHRLGLDLLAALEDEYRDLGRAALGTGDRATIFDRLRNDTSIRPRDDKDLLQRARAVLDRAQGAAPAWFALLPNANCEALATSRGPLAYYVPPSLDGGRGGTFFFNTSDPTAWGCQLESVTFHEAVPGHHFQLALSAELDLPQVRRDMEFTAFIEGWGLYAERLADEMGLYSGPLQRLGMLEGDAMRSARLVVDTGLHALGWTRERAVDFMYDHVPNSRTTIEAEVDRYLATPGQATSYMIGRIAIDKMRRAATQRLGDRFDIRRFHDIVLGGGSMPLDLLAARVEAWPG